MSTPKRILTQTVVALVAIGINILAPEFAENSQYFLLAYSNPINWNASWSTRPSY